MQNVGSSAGQAVLEIMCPSLGSSRASLASVHLVLKLETEAAESIHTLPKLFAVGALA